MWVVEFVVSRDREREGEGGREREGEREYFVVGLWMRGELDDYRALSVHSPEPQAALSLYRHHRVQPTLPPEKCVRF
jgi:hypothetical protein